MKILLSSLKIETAVQGNRDIIVRLPGRPLILVGLIAALFPLEFVQAHEPSALAKQQMLQGGFIDVAWLGAEHMLTGYDHLLFLLGVLFFLSRAVQIVSFITAFTVGHALVLLVATPLAIAANPYLIDALIALTVVYKAVENLGWFHRFLGFETPPLLPMTFMFGLIHGFGLSTRLQEMALVSDPDFFGKIVAFNIGVELGQVAALAFMGAALYLWRHTSRWELFARAVNVMLVIAGLALFAVQLGAFASQPAVAAGLVWRGEFQLTSMNRADIDQ